MAGINQLIVARMTRDVLRAGSLPRAHYRFRTEFLKADSQKALVFDETGDETGQTLALCESLGLGPSVLLQVLAVKTATTVSAR